MINKEHLPEQSHIETQLTEQDIKYLEKFAKEIRLCNCYLEIGTRCGGSALIVARAVNERVAVYSIDPNPDFTAWKGENELSGINFIRGLSQNIAKKWNKPIQMLFIDGHHDEAKYDFDAWEKFVVTQGIIIFHDFARHSPKVISDCVNICLTRNDFEPVIWPGINTPESPHNITSSMFIIRKI